MRRLHCTLCLAFSFGLFAIGAPSQTFTTLASLGPNAPIPIGGSSLVQGIDGNFYGIALGGGKQSFCSPIGCGTVFKITPTGTLTVLHSFCTNAACSDGWEPISLIRGGDGNFYGVTRFGGTHSSSGPCPSGCGTIFKITPAGHLTTLYAFCALANCTDGLLPTSLTQAFQSGDGSTYGDFYGSTDGGGANKFGTMFKMTPNGELTTLYSFIQTANEFAPPGQLLQTIGGNFYGAIYEGTGTNGDCADENNCGAIAEITPSGAVTYPLIFDRPTQPLSPLVQGADGLFYGMSEEGGNANAACAPSGDGCGTIFKISNTGQLTTLYRFCALSNCADGATPIDGLTLATDGNFYGTTQGAEYNCAEGSCPGTLFLMTPSGALTTSHTFCSQPNCTDGSGSAEPLIQGTDGKFYGTTFDGGTNNRGTFFSLAMGLAPFVTFLTSTGQVGKTVQILGQGFTGTTAVSFNGTPSAFTIKSDTYITATVPAGATTGVVSVTTPGGTLTSNVVYRVQP